MITPKDLMRRNAFTMLELVFAIVVLGIIAALAIPRLDRDYRQEAADTILADIRYAQHLALLDDRQKFNDEEWQREFWQFKIESCGGGSGLFISVGSDRDHQGDLDRNEVALDPANGKPMFWKNTDDCSNGNESDPTVSKNIFLTKRFGVDSVTPSGSCATQYIGFDHLGRPHTGFSGSTQPNYASYLSTACIYTFTLKTGESFQIRIEPETGYASIVGQAEL